MHVIDESSPLFGLDQAGIRVRELELHVVVTGTDDITMQTVHALHNYNDQSVRYGFRFEDTLTVLEGGLFVVDLSKFDVVVPDDTPRVSVRA